ncbi:MAG: exodeoxyribonuclease VII large subunit [Clostridia bacterium]|nr:exodeoxyribonuclease VII large subunit [Clostridia bacterium]
MKQEAMTVADLNLYIKNKIATDEFLNNVLVKGEISNFKHHYTGHMYFTLKDENSLIKCIMFKGYTTNLSFNPKDGMRVIILGTVSVYERDGVYQIYCKAMEEQGIGTLYKRYEKLKKDLEQEGLFDLSKKKKIPFMPNSIGVLTSNTGSVIKDIINVSTRRNPKVNIKLLSVPVQGEGAAEKIVEAIKIMNEKKLVDVIILARGGGSLEDLWPFNEEIVARAIFNSELPIISAVGHETDFTISDFVADLRAPTPSAAAELAVPNISDILLKLETCNTRYKLALKKKIEMMKYKFDRCMESRFFKEPLFKINEKFILTDTQIKKMILLVKNKVNYEKLKMGEIVSKLDTLSPLKTLIRGYSITQKGGKIIKSKDMLNKGDIVNIIFNDGQVNAEIIDD